MTELECRIRMEPQHEQFRVRAQKREQLLASGTDAYPVHVPRTDRLVEIRRRHRGLPPESVTGDMVCVAGRLVSVRDGGKLCFATVREGDGTELQVMLASDVLGEERLSSWKCLVDLGDLVGIEGEVVTSRQGELSILASNWMMAAKALRPLPNPHKPLSEEARTRQRYLDLIVRPNAREAVLLRAAVVDSLRRSLSGCGFVEVETPMLQVVPGGAAARPFVTRSNALGMDLYLRVAPELFLKRCVVGGLEMVFEINRNFRNEGIDSSHSPEFAMLEAYEAYADYRSMARLTQELVLAAAFAASAGSGGLIARRAGEPEIELRGNWREATLFGLLSEALGDEVSVTTPLSVLLKYADKHEVYGGATTGSAAKLAEKLFDALVAPTLVQPTLVMDYPEETSPLTRAHRDTSGLAERWDLYIQGLEVATGYSELVDPIVQRRRLEEQARLKAGGDPEAMQLDEEFLRAIEYGMPPSGGIGLGVDRLLMVLSGLGIRDTILFPLVRPAG